jgi:ubiquinone biosynthesis protein
MGGVDRSVDRSALGRDIERVLNQYAGFPLKDIRAAEVLEMVQSVMYRHHIHLPSNYWLLAKTMAIMEGVGLKLDPTFDIFAVSKPYINKLLRKCLFQTAILPKKPSGQAKIGAIL